MSDALVDRGNEIKEEMFGPEHGRAKLERQTDFTRPFEELVCKYCFAEVWGRDEELPRNIRSMITIAMLVALGRVAGGASAREGCNRQRRHQGSDPRSPHARVDLLRCARGRRRLSQRVAGARRSSEFA